MGFNSARPKTVIFPPAVSGTSDENYNPRNTQCMDARPTVFKRSGYNFRLPPLKVRDLRLDLGENISFSGDLPVTNPASPVGLTSIISFLQLPLSVSFKL